MNISPHVFPLLTTKVVDFIAGGQWKIPAIVQQAFPNMTSLMRQVTPP